MQFQTFPPPPDLADVVEHFWAVENFEPLDRHREILVPNGRPTVLLCLGDPGVRIREDAPARANVSNIAGPLTRPIVLEQSGKSSYAAAQLHPWGLAGLKTGALVDDTAGLGQIIGADLSGAGEKAAAAAPFGPERVGPVADIVQRLKNPMPQHRLAAIRAAIEMVDRERGLVDLDALGGGLGIGYDALYRLLKGMVGLSPKQYVSIIRFYHFTGELLKDQFGSLALLSGLQGYYDQAHATRDFRRYTGISQTRFRRQLNGIARLMHGAP